MTLIDEVGSTRSIAISEGKLKDEKGEKEDERRAKISTLNG